jgi:hypothetical protein
MGQLASETRSKDLCFKALGCREAVGVQKLEFSLYVFVCFLCMLGDHRNEEWE